MEQVLSCRLYESPVIIDHTKEALELLDSRWWFDLSNGLNLAGEWLNAMLVTEVAQKLDGRFSKHALLAVNYKAIGLEDTEDSSEIFEMLVGGRRRYQDIVKINEDVRDISEYLVHQTLKILPSVL